MVGVGLFLNKRLLGFKKMRVLFSLDKFFSFKRHYKDEVYKI